MIVLLGSTGYIGQAFAQELELRGERFIPLSRDRVDYTKYNVLVEFLRDQRVTFLINAAGYTGRPNVDACETARADTLQGNTIFPLTVSHACLAAGVPWGHVSSGCIYTGAKVTEGGQTRVEPDLTRPDISTLLENRSPSIQGFREDDPPNFSFRRTPCSFYSGTKALAEESLAEDGQLYMWRLRIPFDEQDNARNYLSKLQRYDKVYQNFNSLSHRLDFVRACLDLWKLRAPFGIYNVTNPGYVSSRDAIEMIQRSIAPARHFEFWTNDGEFYREAAKTPRSNCLLNVDKLLATGIQMRRVEEALEDALKHWKKEPQSLTGHNAQKDQRKRSVAAR